MDIGFVGPDAQTIDLLGKKSDAREAAMAAGVPIIPGYQGADQSEAKLIEEANKIGYPILVKASSGGGGKGMRKVFEASEMKQAIESARREALSAFGNDELILEKLLINSRHIEIQIFGDCQGHVFHLGERECSLQRRHQKVIEECPSPFVSAALRKRMADAAVELGAHLGYKNSGTVEFLVDNDENFYFLEVNTRLQVEHCVTEEVYGVDLVRSQLLTAVNKPIGLGFAGDQRLGQ